MQTVAEITAALAKLEALMVEKGVVRPEATLLMKCSGKFSTHIGCMYLQKAFGNSDHKIFSETTAQESIQAAFDYINAMPDPAVAERQNWHKDLADVIDRGHAMALPDEVMQPLRQGSQAMTENLLTHEASE
jgi:hypothetical protein